MSLGPHGIQMPGVKDPLDELQDFVDNIPEVIFAPDAYMTVYDDRGSIFHGKIFEDVAVSDRAMEIQRQWMRPQFRVRIYYK